MREILFRGKRLDNGEWVVGSSLGPSFDGDYYIVTYVIGNHRVCGECGCPFDCDDLYEVDPATVGQYTGLCDKNGVKIFEGDICNWKSTVYSNTVPYAVEYVVNDCRYVLKGTVDRIPILDELKIEVIGNIYDKEEQDALQGKFAQDGRCTFDE